VRAWPEGVPHRIDPGTETLWDGYAARAQREPDAHGLHCLGRSWTWRELVGQAEHLAGALQRLGVAPGDRVVLFSQNCPQFVIGFHAIVRCGAVVVPINPMNKAAELEGYLRDAQPVAAIASSDIAGELATAAAVLCEGGSAGHGAGGGNGGGDGPGTRDGNDRGNRGGNAPAAGSDRLRHLIVFDLADALSPELQRDPSPLPAAWRDWLPLRHARPSLAQGDVHDWSALIGPRHAPAPVDLQAGDLVLLPYTSGTTGQPKGCLHTHSTLLHNALGAAPWLDMRAGDVLLVAVPMFHITGLVMGMLATIRHGGTLVVLPRWDRIEAARAIARHRVTHWPNIPTMVIDLLAAPELAQFDLGSLRYIGGGGAAMPEAVAARLHEQFGLSYVEGYGLTETAAPTHTNPRHAARRHCLGIPWISTEARVVDPATLAPMPVGEVGEILVHGPQVFHGYWGKVQETEAAFVTLDGRRWFRTGDLGRVDADGYYYIADRLKRMINASGFKVWPAEVEALLHHHPAVQEACVIARRDPYRGETVKAVIVPRPEHRARVSARDIVEWAREHMAAYKYPREIDFVDALPRSASGKVMWRTLQAEQDARDAGNAGDAATTPGA
jgi:fatty-acyl-CoA synthase